MMMRTLLVGVMPSFFCVSSPAADAGGLERGGEVAVTTPGGGRGIVVFLLLDLRADFDAAAAAVAGIFDLPEQGRIADAAVAGQHEASLAVFDHGVLEVDEAGEGEQGFDRVRHR